MTDDITWKYICVDIHNMIFFNDRFGHIAGDKLIEDLESRFKIMGVEDLKRVSGNKWSFKIKWDIEEMADDILLNLMSWSQNVLHVCLNVVISPEPDREEESIYQLRVAANSGGHLLLKLPYTDNH